MEKVIWARGQYEREGTVMPGQESAWGGVGELWAACVLGLLGEPPEIRQRCES